MPDWYSEGVASQTLQDAFDEFRRLHPEYDRTAVVDVLRETEYARIGGHVYLDYTGASLAARSQVRDHHALIDREVLGNPHSASAASAASTALVERTRRAVLGWFGVSPVTHCVVFTPNCTGALKLVGESFPFAPGGTLLLSTDNHNSANGIREFARARGATVQYAPLTVPDLRLDRPRVEALLDAAADAPDRLFVFPAQSNVTGVRHPLDLVARARAAGWTVVLDAAAYVPTSALDLAAVPADFVTVSFYKMFGYPTGVGALVARRDALARLRRPWFAGGTVNFATVQGRRHLLSPGEAGFEDGTLDFLAIPAVEIGLRHLASVGIETIRTRVECLTDWTLREMLDLRHGNGRPMVRIYGPASMAQRGGTITWNAYDPEGHLLDYRRVEELAVEAGISLRTGCFCNPGAGETAEGLTEEEMLEAIVHGADMTLPRFLQFLTERSGKSAGAIRVSFGIASAFTDAWRFVTFLEGLRDQSQMALGTASFDIESCRVIRDGA
jgi:molybdenum cofactor sulfurtransferase